jgi:L-lysine exporter family protein LysE/ArgO
MKSVWTGFMLSLSLCLDLGIVNIAILRTAVQHDGHAAFVLGVGSTLGDLVYFTLAAMGAAALAAWAPFRLVLWLFGSAALLWLAWKTTRSVLHPKALDLSGAAPRMSYRSALTVGMGLALASPSAILWFAAVGGSVIASSTGRGPVWAFAGGFAAAGVVFAAGLAYGTAAVRHIAGTTFVRAMSLASAVLFVYFAARVFLGGVREFLPRLGF